MNNSGYLNIIILNPVNQSMAANHQPAEIFSVTEREDTPQKRIFDEQIRHPDRAFSEICRRLRGLKG